jgi:hypothetical protein
MPSGVFGQPGRVPGWSVCPYCQIVAPDLGDEHHTVAVVVDDGDQVAREHQGQRRKCPSHSRF